VTLGKSAPFVFEQRGILDEGLWTLHVTISH
jgi:hypothetical protein